MALTKKQERLAINEALRAMDELDAEEKKAEDEELVEEDMEEEAADELELEEEEIEEEDDETDLSGELACAGGACEIT